MSFKRKIQYQYRNFLHAIYSWRLPAWLTCPAARIGIIFLIVVFAFGYIVKTASSAATGYQIYSLENKVYDLETDIKKMEIDIADASSMTSIQKRLSSVKMVKISIY